MKTKILMVCLGNICRSPVAEGILRSKIEEAGLSKLVVVDSCGTSGYHDGEPPDPRSQENAVQNGLDISNLRSRKFTYSDFNDFDKIYCMDSSNYNDLKSLYPEESVMEKVDLLLNVVTPNKNRKVPDPYFGGTDGFQNVYNLIEEACEKIILNLENSYK